QRPVGNDHRRTGDRLRLRLEAGEDGPEDREEKQQRHPPGKGGEGKPALHGDASCHVRCSSRGGAAGGAAAYTDAAAPPPQPSPRGGGCRIGGLAPSGNSHRPTPPPLWGRLGGG